MVIRNIFVSILVLISFHSKAQKTENIFLITLDGLRWQEVFGGAVDSMMLNKDLVDDDSVFPKFSAKNRDEAREKLMPFFWTSIAKEGQIIGNRWKGSKMNCTNRFWFSYPGYNEILTGFSDPIIDSNSKEYNQNKTILEIANESPAFSGKVAAFCSWDVFPYIINDKRSGIYVNAGFEKADHEQLNDKEVFLNQLQDEIPSPWGAVRLDAFTHHFMMEYVKANYPKLVYISYGETDDFAHNGKYDAYLKSAHQTDQWIKEIWEFIQSDPFYRNKTTLLITTDHGRGSSPMIEWKSHGTIYKGSDQIWAAVLGPDISSTGESKKEEQYFQNQIAKTVSKLLGIDYDGGRYEAGKPIDRFLSANK